MYSSKKSKGERERGLESAGERGVEGEESEEEERREPNKTHPTPGRRLVGAGTPSSPPV